MKNNRLITTLFMLSSLDGKISTGNTDNMDVDTDYKKIKGIREGVRQYYELEQETDLHFLITGKVMTKECGLLNVNEKKDTPQKIGSNCIIVDNKNLKESGVKYLLKKFNSLTVVTTNELHPANKIKSVDLKIIQYSKEINFDDLFEKLKNKHGIKRLTIQSGGTLNAVLLRKKLIDRVSIVIAPCLIGGVETPSLIDGESFHKTEELKGIKALKLEKCDILKNSFLHLVYNVINKTEIIN